jgi:hypothetical protein
MPILKKTRDISDKQSNDSLNLLEKQKQTKTKTADREK